jgi:hypothetical protein
MSGGRVVVTHENFVMKCQLQKRGEQRPSSAEARATGADGGEQ